MGILDRLGQVLKSYLNNDDSTYTSRERSSYNDPDVNAAYDELNEFLNKDKAAESKYDFAAKTGGAKPKTPVPEELRPDFAELEVVFGASAEECKESYKKLLKIHHPDKHTKHEGNFKKATAKTAKINAAYDRIEKWRTGN